MVSHILTSDVNAWHTFPLLLFVFFFMYKKKPIALPHAPDPQIKKKKKRISQLLPKRPYPRLPGNVNNFKK